MDEKIDRLQRHLALLRGCAGWTAANLAERLGVKRQTVSTLEQGPDKYQMTKMQYLAIRRTFDEEISLAKDETQMLSLVIDAIIDNPELYTPQERTEILEKAQLLAPAIIKQPSQRKDASNTWKAILAASGIVASVALMAFLKKKD